MSLRKILKKIGASTDELEVGELQDDAAKMSCCPLGDLHRGSQARVTGRLRSVTYTPRETVPTLVAASIRVAASRSAASRADAGRPNAPP